MNASFSEQPCRSRNEKLQAAYNQWASQFNVMSPGYTEVDATETTIPQSEELPNLSVDEVENVLFEVEHSLPSQTPTQQLQTTPFNSTVYPIAVPAYHQQAVNWDFMNELYVLDLNTTI